MPLPVNKTPAKHKSNLNYFYINHKVKANLYKKNRVYVPIKKPAQSFFEASTL